jgi:hypothetical protein
VIADALEASSDQKATGFGAPGRRQANPTTARSVERAPAAEGEVIDSLLPFCQLRTGEFSPGGGARRAGDDRYPEGVVRPAGQGEDVGRLAARRSWTDTHLGGNPYLADRNSGRGAVTLVASHDGDHP